MTTRASITASLLWLMTGLVLTGCGTEEPASPPASTPAPAANESPTESSSGTLYPSLPPLAAPAPGGFFDRENHDDIFVSFPSNSLSVSFAAQKVCVERANLETKKQGKSGEVF